MNAGKYCNILSVVGILGMVIYFFYLWKKGVLTSQEELQMYIAGFGALGELMFMLIQVVQVVIPILPGGISCLAGVILFGAGWGFVYNYVGICIGSIIAFLIAKAHGRPLLNQMFEPEMIAKYDNWTESNHRFTKLFALAIFFPCAPDDFLCYLAGTTSMNLRTFTTIILLGKPGSIALYSLGLSVIFNWISNLV
jgi:uncharacterized membrane protein YdjX (TVP38/TMEM64 family)